MFKDGTPSHGIPLNLQLFAEGDPIPTDPAPIDPQPTDPTPPQDPVPTDPTPEPQYLKVKYNHEEKEIPYEEAVQLAQKGLNYERAIERAQQEARDNYIAEQGFSWNGKPITTEAEYKAALREREMQQKGIDPEVVNQLLEQHPDIQFAKELKAKQEQEAQQQAQFAEFYEMFPNVTPDQITPEVVKLQQQKGLSLVDAFMRVNWGKQKAEGEQEAVRKLINNAQSSPGSLSQGGEAPKASVKDMSKTDFEDMILRVKRGEKVTL